MSLFYRPTVTATVIASALALLVIISQPRSAVIAADAKLHNRLLKLKGQPGTDHRIIVDSTAAPWRAVGRLNRRSGGHCTATVIAPNRVLTAAHCLWNKRTQKYIPYQALHFVAGWSKGEYLFHSKASSITPAPDYLTYRTKGIAAFTHDWAIVTLIDNPVPTTGVITPRGFAKGQFQPRKADTGPYIQAGYSADKRHVLTAHVNCAVWGIEKKLNVALHACDALPGDSGSPMITKDKSGRYHLVAIHVGNLSTGGTGTGIAVPASTFLNHLNGLK